MNYCSKCKHRGKEPFERPCAMCKNTLSHDDPEREKRQLLYEPEGEEVKPDLINHPAHYCYSKYEPKDVIRAWGLNFNLGSAVKYIARAGRKDDIIQELKKAKTFIGFEIEALEAEKQ